MPKTKKKFIDRKKAVTFNLVHRSQRDPLIADETAPQRVLVPVNAAVPPSKDKDQSQNLTLEQRKEQQRKYGIYFDDDYNYLQHLKDTKEVTMLMQPKPDKKKKAKTETVTSETEKVITENIKLPSSVFASEVEEEVGLLNRAASQGLCLQLDPEVVAALDDDFDFEDPQNELEDNFIELAMGDGEDEDEDEEEDDEFNEEDEEVMSEDAESDKAFASDLDSDDDSGSQDQSRRPKMPSWDPQDKDDTKSRFSQYSMSSSVIKRNQGLSLLDHRFEKMYAEYDDTEVGALDLDDIEGFMPESHDRLLKAAEEFEESRRRYQLDKEAEVVRDTHKTESHDRLLKAAEEFKESRRRYQLDKEAEVVRLQQLQEIIEESEEDDLVTMEVEPKEKWDCETILSTYSNLYNHPKIIDEPKKPKKIQLNAKGIPKDTLGKDNKLTIRSLAKFNAQLDAGLSGSESDYEADERTHAESVLSTLSVLSLSQKPKKIQLNAKGIPKDTLGKDNKLTIRSLAKFNAQLDAGLSGSESDYEADERTHAESVLSTLSVLSLRPKDETPEEKRERKRLLREYRRERRFEKKANREAFKEEKKRQEKIMMNNRNNVQGNRIL